MLIGEVQTEIQIISAPALNFGFRLAAFMRIGGAGFYLRYVSGSGSITANGVFYSDTSVSSSCRGLRPVLQVAK